MNFSIENTEVSALSQKIIQVLNVSSTVLTMADLRRKTGVKLDEVVQVLNHSIKGDKGGGMFLYDADDDASLDNNGTIIVTVDGLRFKRIFEGAVSISWFGARDVDVAGNAGYDSTLAIQAAVQSVTASGGIVSIPKGRYLVSATIPVDSFNEIIAVVGDNKRNSVVYTLTNITVFRVREASRIENLQILQQGVAHTGRAISTSDTVQVQRAVFRDLYIDGFKYGIWLRCSLYSTFEQIYITNCGTGIKCSRNGLPDPVNPTTMDEHDPAATQTWNNQPVGVAGGFFHNVNTFVNCTVKSCEVGIWGSMQTNNFISCSVENGRTSLGITTPVGTLAIGVFLRGGVNNTSSFGNSGNVFDAFYTELVDVPFRLEAAGLSINGYLQPNNPVVVGSAGINATNSVIERLRVTSTGQFERAVVATGSRFYGRIDRIGASLANTLTNTFSEIVPFNITTDTFVHTFPYTSTEAYEVVVVYVQNNTTSRRSDIGRVLLNPGYAFPTIAGVDGTTVTGTTNSMTVTVSQAGATQLRGTIFMRQIGVE